MKTISAAEFKARCLTLMDDVNRTRETLVITKRGKPVARLVLQTRKGESSSADSKG